MTADDAKELAQQVTRSGELMEKIADVRDTARYALEGAAHKVLQARKAYRRSGQHPNIEFEDDGTTEDISDSGVSFRITNSIDRGDDFGVTLTWDELAADPEGEAERVAAEQRAESIRSLEQQHTNLGARLEYLKAGLDLVPDYKPDSDNGCPHCSAAPGTRHHGECEKYPNAYDPEAVPQ